MAELFLEKYSKPLLRTPKTHEANARGVMHLVKAFGDQRLADLERRDRNLGDRAADLQGTHADEEGPSRSGEQGCLDS